MAGYRRDRVNDQMTREMGEIIRLVKDPRVSSAFVSIVRSDVTPDCKFAKIYYSVLDDENAKEVHAGIVSATGFIRKQIAERMNLRVTPALTFIRDDTIGYGAGIDKLFRRIASEREEAEKERPEKEERSGDEEQSHA